MIVCDRVCVCVCVCACARVHLSVDGPCLGLCCILKTDTSSHQGKVLPVLFVSTSSGGMAKQVFQSRGWKPVYACKPPVRPYRSSIRLDAGVHRSATCVALPRPPLEVSSHSGHEMVKCQALCSWAQVLSLLDKSAQENVILRLET